MPPHSRVPWQRGTHQLTGWCKQQTLKFRTPPDSEAHSHNHHVPNHEHALWSWTFTSNGNSRETLTCAHHPKRGTNAKRFWLPPTPNWFGDRTRTTERKTICVYGYLQTNGGGAEEDDARQNEEKIYAMRLWTTMKKLRLETLLIFHWLHQCLHFHARLA